SQTGPMVLSRTRRRFSASAGAPPTVPLLRPSTGKSMPTPKSKPSRTKYPVQSTPRTMNQNVARSIAITWLSLESGRSVGEHQRGLVVPLAGLLRLLEGLGAAPDIGEEELDLYDGQDAVEEGVDDHRGDHLSGGDPGGDTSAGGHQA